MEDHFHTFTLYFSSQKLFYWFILLLLFIYYFILMHCYLFTHISENGLVTICQLGGWSWPQRCSIFIQCVIIATQAKKQQRHRKWAVPRRKGMLGKPPGAFKQSKSAFTNHTTFSDYLWQQQNQTARSGRWTAWICALGWESFAPCSPSGESRGVRVLVGTVILSDRPVFQRGEVGRGMFRRWWRCSWGAVMLHTTRAQNTAETTLHRLSATVTAAIILHDCQVSWGWRGKTLLRYSAKKEKKKEKNRWKPVWGDCRSLRGPWV